MKNRIQIFFTIIIVIMIAGSGLRLTGSVNAQSEPPIYFPIFMKTVHRYYAYGLDGGTVENVLIDSQNSDIIYAGTWGNGIYKSIDGGSSWLHISEGLRSAYVYDVAIDPNNSQHLLASVYERGIDQSFDGGVTWSATSGFPGYAVVYSIDFNPTDPTIVYAAIREATIYDSNGIAVWWPGGVWKSTNGGTNWLDTSNNLIEDYIYDLAIDPRNPNIIYTANHKTGIYKTTDGGGSWVKSSNGLVHEDIRGIQVDPINNRVNAGLWDGYGYTYSTNNGESWVSVSSTNLQDLYVWEVQIDPNYPSGVYLTTSSGVYFCENPTSESVCSLVSDKDEFVFDVALDVNGPIVYPGKTKNVYTGIQYNAIHKSTNGGISFDPIYKGIRANIIKSILINPSNPNIQYISSYGRGLFKSINGGVTWNALHDKLSLEWINDIVLRPGQNNVLYIGDQQGGVYYSVDYGESWDSGNLGLTRSVSEEMITADENGEVNPPQGVYDWMDPIDYKNLMDAQQDNSETRATSSISVATINFDKDRIQYMFAGMDGSGIKFSDSHGMYWNSSNIGSGSAMDSMVDPSLSSNYNFIGMVNYGIKASTDRVNWVDKNSGLTTTSVYALELLSNGVYLAGTANGVFKTINGAASWTRSTGLAGIKVTDIQVDPTNASSVWATTYEGLYHSIDSGNSWNPYPLADLLNNNLMIIIAVPGSSEFYLGSDGGDLYHFVP